MYGQRCPKGVSQKLKTEGVIYCLMTIATARAALEQLQAPADVMSSWMAPGPFLPCRRQAWLHTTVWSPHVLQDIIQGHSLTCGCGAVNSGALIGLSMAVINEASTLFTQLKVCGDSPVT